MLPELVHVSTPSYSGTHAEGFHAAVKAVVEALAKSGPRQRLVNLLPGMVSPADLRYLKEVARRLRPAGHPAARLLRHAGRPHAGTSTSGFPAGGTPLEAIRSDGPGGRHDRVRVDPGPLPDSRRRLARAPRRVPPSAWTCRSESARAIAFFDLLSSYAGKAVPAKHAAERGRLVDAYIDAHKYLSSMPAIVYGEEDLVVGLTAFLTEVGIKPVLCGSGGRSGRLGPAVKRFAPDAVVRSGVDFLELEEAASRAFLPIC